jgi:hypothetical protein
MDRDPSKKQSKEKEAFFVKPYPAFTVSGNTEPYQRDLQRLGGTWSEALKTWVFEQRYLADVRQFQKERFKAEDKCSTVGAERRGEKWSQEEEKQLCVELQRGDCIGKISTDHGRTESGITSRMCAIIVRLHNEGMTIPEIRAIISCSSMFIEEAIQKSSK